jgi:hypothetical protein
VSRRDIRIERATPGAVSQFTISRSSRSRRRRGRRTIPLRSDSFPTRSAGAITKWRWDYRGVGAFDVDEIGAQNHTFTFTGTGVYPAVLEVTNDLGQVARSVVTITATNPLPTATAVVTPSNGPPPLAVTLTGTGTSPNGTIVKYEWDRLGNGTFDFSSTTTGTTTFTYPQPGTYNAVFRVTDSFGQVATAPAAATQVRVGPPGSPIARITAPSGPVTGSASRSDLPRHRNAVPVEPSEMRMDFNGDDVRWQLALVDSSFT